MTFNYLSNKELLRMYFPQIWPYFTDLINIFEFGWTNQINENCKDQSMEVGNICKSDIKDHMLRTSLKT